MPEFDQIVVGRGLAGIVMSEELRRRGQRVLVIDHARSNRATQVAAGSVNPISFKRVILSWRAGEMIREALSFYLRLQNEYGIQLLTPLSSKRVHSSHEESQLWSKRSLEEPICNYISAGSLENDNVQAPYGVSDIAECFWLDTKLLLRQHARYWSGSGQLLEKEVVNSGTEAGSTITIAGHTAKQVVYCIGAFDSLSGLIPVQGEVLTVRIPGLNLAHAVHRSCFVIPVGNELYKVGSTYDWKNTWEGSTDAGRDRLLKRLRTITDLPIEIVHHEAGTRPTTKDRRPLVGPRPDCADRYVLNGLGSRGVMLAPWCARHLADQILDGRDPAKEVDPARFV